MADAAELLGAGEPGGPGADDGDDLAATGMCGLRLYPALLKGPLDDAELHLPDGDRGVIKAEDAGRLAGGGAEPARELWKVIGGVQALDSLTPAVAVHQVVP